ncbi:MAG TPA: hypothetical protein VFE15_06270 [Marmoricola sp.]|nr:hypothetical protein [Marmoricola sp.]
MAGVTIDELLIADPPEAWATAGFTVEDGVCRVGTVRLRLVGRDGELGDRYGLIGWTLRDVPSDHEEVDGVPTTRSESDLVTGAAHLNGVTVIDHVVLMSPDLGRTVVALAGLGLQPRRERDGELGGRAIRQVFYRLGDVILELVGAPDAAGDGPAGLWGITFTVADLDATAAYFAELASPVKDAVQPGRRITTLRHRELDLSVRCALISGR